MVYLSDFNESEVVLNGDVSLVAGVLDELIQFGEVLAEGLVGVDDGELRVIPAEFSSFGVKIPDGLGDEEVVVITLSIAAGRDVEVGISSIVVQMNSVTF